MTIIQLCVYSYLILTAYIFILQFVPIGVKLMFLKEFGTTMLQRQIKDVLKVADKQPILITRQNKEGYVMMSKKAYAKLVKAAQ